MVANTYLPWTCEETARAEELKAAYQRIARLEADLVEVLEYLQGIADISSVPEEDGSPRPNTAMRLASMLEETLHGRPY